MNARPNPHVFDDSQRVKLARILAMTSSPFDAEALTAARKANAFLRSYGKTWIDALCGHAPAPIDAGRSPRATRKASSRERPAHWNQAAVDVLRCGLASPWEIAFCESLLAKWAGRAISAKQGETLRRIWRERCEYREAPA